MQDAVSIAVSPAPESRTGERLRTVARNAFPFLVVGALWEIVARAGVFPRKLFPTLGDVATAFVDLTRAGILPMHAAETVLRLLSGFALAALVGVTIGVLMGRSRRAADILLPLDSILAPIPRLAYRGLHQAQSGQGDLSAVLVVPI